MKKAKRSWRKRRSSKKMIQSKKIEKKKRKAIHLQEKTIKVTRCKYKQM